MNTSNKHAKPHPQARIVVGGGIDATGNLSKISISRMAYAIDKHHQTPLPLVLSGGWSLLAETIPARTEAEAMRDYALRAGVGAADIHTEEKSMETIGNAYYTYTDFISQHNWRDIEVITSAFHGERTKYSFEKVLGSCCKAHLVKVPDDGLFTPSERLQLEAREQRVMAFIRQLFDPITNGDIEAIGNTLRQLPGYSTEPKYTRQDLLKIVAGNADLGGSYS